MKDSFAGKVLCTASPIIAGLAHVFMFHIGLVPYPLVGAIAVASGVCGIVVSVVARKKLAEHHVSKPYVLLAIIGIIVGAFYASVLGPFILFFPKI